MPTRGQVKGLADRLISTLDKTMPSNKADAIVRDVAEEIYIDLLGIPGNIVVDRDEPVGIMHGGFGKNGKKAAMPIARYKFQPKSAAVHGG